MRFPLRRGTEEGVKFEHGSGGEEHPGVGVVEHQIGRFCEILQPCIEVGFAVADHRCACVGAGGDASGAEWSGGGRERIAAAYGLSEVDLMLEVMEDGGKGWRGG